MNTKLEIAKIVQEEFNAPEEFWTVKSHARKYSYPKKALTYVLRQCTVDNLVDIAAFMGYADHSTVIYHSEDCEGMMQVYDDYNMKITIIIKKVKDLIKEVTENYAV
jgi:chromosomal replication initiation ATPase DnaA